MTGPAEDEVEVLAREHGELRWSVVAWGDDEDLMTMVRVHRGGRLVKDSGFGGPPLYPDELVNEWRGRSDGLPCLVMARTDPSIDRLTAVTDRGTEVDLVMSAVVPRFGLRFGAAVLPDGEAPGWLRARSGGRTVAELRTPMPR
jgi:hypothetical protein